MVAKKIILSVIILILFLFIDGCTLDVTKKDEFTRPVRIHLKITGYIPFLGLTLYCTEPNYHRYIIRFDEWRIGIKGIHFEGKRETGEEVVFDTDPETDFLNKEFNQWNGIISEFDLPQGTYNSLKWDINLRKISANEFEDDTTSLNAGLFITGHWSRKEGWGEPEIPFIFAVPDTVMFSFRSYLDNIFYDNKDYGQTLTFNIDYAFWTVIPELFDKAEITGDSLNKKIIFSVDRNKDLYEGLLDRLKTTLVLKVTSY